MNFLDFFFPQLPIFYCLYFQFVVTQVIWRNSDCRMKGLASSILIHHLLAQNYSLRFIFGMSSLAYFQVTEISGLPSFVSLNFDYITSVSELRVQSVVHSAITKTVGFSVMS